MYKAKTTFHVPGHKTFKKGEIYKIEPKLASDLVKRGIVEEVKSKSDERRLATKDSKNTKAKDDKSKALKK